MLKLYQNLSKKILKSRQIKISYMIIFKIIEIM
jgi:hypothetical protein